MSEGSNDKRLVIWNGRQNTSAACKTAAVSRAVPGGGCNSQKQHKMHACDWRVGYTPTAATVMMARDRVNASSEATTGVAASEPALAHTSQNGDKQRRETTCADSVVLIPAGVSR